MLNKFVSVAHSAALSVTTQRLSDLQISQDRRLDGISTTLDGISIKMEELSAAVSRKSKHYHKMPESA